MGHKGIPHTKRKDYAIDGTFYEVELQKVTPKGYFKVEKF